jgi:hypothetical protein
VKNQNLLMRAAVASALVAGSLSAQAGTLSNAGVNFASQLFGTTSTTALELLPAATTYTFSTVGGIVLNNNGVINIYYRLAGGAKFTAAISTGDISGTVITGLGLTKTSTALSTDGTTVVVTLTNSTGGNVTIGVGATVIWTPAATRSVSSVNGILNTVGNTVTMTASASVLAAAVNSATLPSDVDGGVAAAVTLGTAKSAITGAIKASSAFAAPETQKIDVAATPTSQAKMTTGVNTASTTIVNLGSLTFTNVAGVKQLDGATDYTIASRTTATSLGGTVTGTFSGTPTAKLTTDLACTTAIAAGSAATLNTGLTTFTFSSGTQPTTATPNYVCLTVDGTTVIPATTPTASFSLTPTTATDAPATASGSLYALATNGSTKDLRAYVPAGVTGGYTSYVRIINTGTSAAPISVAVIDPTTGTPGTSNVVVSSLASGAAVNLSSTQIEAVTGAITSTTRPRLRFTGPTSGLDVQSWFINPDGTITDLTGAQ